MSKSLRISDDLAERAEKAARLFHRSPPQQVEHWAQIGRAIETALSFPALVAAKRSGRKELDEALDAVGTAQATNRVHAIIARTAGSIESAD